MILRREFDASLDIPKVHFMVALSWIVVGVFGENIDSKVDALIADGNPGPCDQLAQLFDRLAAERAMRWFRVLAFACQPRRVGTLRGWLSDSRFAVCYYPSDEIHNEIFNLLPAPINPGSQVRLKNKVNNHRDRHK